jgi:hypothetical protein
LLSSNHRITYAKLAFPRKRLCPERILLKPQVSPLRFPGFPFEIGGIAHFMRLSLKKAAHVAIVGAA